MAGDVEVVVVTVPIDEAEVAADALWLAGAAAVEERQATEPGLVVLIADVEPQAPAPGWQVERRVLDDGIDAWRAHARAWRAGSFVVQPPWVAGGEAPRPGDVVLVVDPGDAFGSGSHVTTRLALAALAAIGCAGATVLDVGCGSGVLAIAAARLGAARVEAIDVDDAAVLATVDNAARNGVSDVVRASTRAVTDLEPGYDVVVANIGLGVLVDLAEALERVTVVGGHVVLTGVLEGDIERLAGAYEGGHVVSTAVDEGWALVALERRQ